MTPSDRLDTGRRLTCSSAGITGSSAMITTSPRIGSGMDGNARWDVEAIIGEDGIRQFLAPIEEPGGLPDPACWSPDWLALESTRVFS